MHIVAIHGLSGDKRGLIPELAAALEVTNFEASSRLNAPGSGPFVVGVFADKDPAGKLEERLSAKRFSILTLSTPEIETEAGQRYVRKFDMSDNVFGIETNSGEHFSVPYQDVELIVRGTLISSSSSMETKKERKFDLATAVVSSGLKVMKTTKTTQAVTREDRQAFFNLYSRAVPTLVFTENGLLYDGLGPSRALSRSANFLQLLADLRNRCPNARYDERLLNKAGAAALLGPRLNPEEHHVIATALLAKALRKS